MKRVILIGLLAYFVVVMIPIKNSVFSAEKASLDILNEVFAESISNPDHPYKFQCWQDGKLMIDERELYNPKVGKGYATFFRKLAAGEADRFGSIPVQEVWFILGQQTTCSVLPDD